MSTTLPIGILHEHPTWFRPLFAELKRRGIPHERVDAAAQLWDPAARPAWSLVLNRASPSAYLRGNARSIFTTLDFLHHLERRGVPVVNGSGAYALEISKARQLGLLHELGLPHPRARVINDASRAVAAASGLRFPVLVKANVGGSGAGIVRYDTREQLREAADAGLLDLGLDHTALVQELAPLRGGHITRVEVLGGRLLYALRVFPADSFNLCPAEACQTTAGVALDTSCVLEGPKNGMRVERAEPPPRVVDQVLAITRAAGIDVGGVEYLVDDRDGEVYFYDVNALSNFVADAPRVVGFDPYVDLVDHLLERLAQRRAAGETAAA
jgi:glutathione synthase/RimK-type ligase-like ATP-grasp enzyme